MTCIEIGVLAGLLWAFALVVWALTEMTLGEADRLLIMVMYIYEGFTFTPKGILIGACWAFADGFIAGYLFGLLINLA